MVSKVMQGVFVDYDLTMSVQQSNAPCAPHRAIGRTLWGAGQPVPTDEPSQSTTLCPWSSKLEMVDQHK